MRFLGRFRCGFGAILEPAVLGPLIFAPGKMRAREVPKVRQRVRQTLAQSLAHNLLLMISTVNGVRRAGALLFLIRNYKYYILYKKVVRQPGAPHLLWKSLIKVCAPRNAPRSGALSGAPKWRSRWPQSEPFWRGLVPFACRPVADLPQTCHGRAANLP